METEIYEPELLVRACAKISAWGLVVLRPIQQILQLIKIGFALNWYRANLAPRLPGLTPNLPPVQAPTLGIWSTNDHYLDGERMKMSGRFVKGPWRYEQIDGASHWIPLDAFDRLNQLLIEWLG
jgi:pimeloyl-ACP methyl ester carboxylesterase